VEIVGGIPARAPHSLRRTSRRVPHDLDLLELEIRLMECTVN
jgi:hypothetical protein